MSTAALTISQAQGPPLATVSRLLAGPRVDHLLRRAARRFPERVAFHSRAGDLGYAELDERATRCAAGLHELLGEDRGVVAVSTELTTDFPVAFFGVSRSGRTSALINPLLPDERLVHLLTACGAGAAIVSRALRGRLAPLRDRLPGLRRLILVEEAVQSAGPVPEQEQGEEDVACLLFTSGTTGAPKVVRLTHRNLTVNAAQTAYGNRLTESSVMFNFLPAFHSMHLTAGVAAGAGHVLADGDDPVESVRTAAAHEATHYYSLPTRLARLAADPRLAGLAAPTLRAMLSGGAALPASAAGTLSAHFGIPVVQGYGMAETSPSMHLGSLDRPKTGSCGVLVPGGECRVVDIETRRPVPIGAKGEIQVRGPQLMRGYLGRDLAEDVDDDGWFATGDVGYLDEDAYLFLVDRVKDVFKVDNWLVAPTDIERVLLRHPGVADCVVVDQPDEIHGAAPHALVVPSETGAQPADLIRFVAAHVPEHERLRHVELVEGIPRSPIGKVDRRALRARLAARRAGS